MATHSEANLNQSEPIRNLKFLWFFRLPVWNESESNLKLIWNLKSLSETELEGKSNLTLSETELKVKVNQTQSETELEGAFHHGGSSLRFHTCRLLPGGPPLCLNLPPPLNPHWLCPGLLTRTNPNGLLWNLSLLLHHEPLILRPSFLLHPHHLDSRRLSFARNKLSF